MNKFNVILGVLAVISSAGAMAFDGAINFNGKVVDQTCSVDTASKNLTVTLPTVAATSLGAVSKTTGMTPFYIKLTGCGVDNNQSKKVKLFFDNSATVDANTGNLINTATGTKAENVQVQLMNADATTEIKLNNDFADQQVSATDIAVSDVTLRYNARYYSTDVVTAGDVKATVNYTIAYE
ncbi:fimbrial protein [Salmonella enterica subsp. enterica serovar Montevideo]|nr:fimbrial protein [Salmonella enterica subsp. enterica serovar Montevideo]